MSGSSIDESNAPALAQNRQYVALQADLSAALAAFDRAQDWADLIHDLQRVNRVFSKHSHTSYLPEKHLLAKRLAQCLTSSLPSGVHLKALDTYRVVFARIGPARLALDLPLYAGGLFPLFSYSATSLKPAVLSLYESTLLPLGPSLVPYLDGFVLAILPGLEDESSEFYDRSVALLDAVSDAVSNDAPSFCRALWRALLLSPPMRLAATGYIRARLAADKKLPWTASLLDEMPLVAYAMATALNDQNALVQRAVLDLLLEELSLHQEFFQGDSEEARAAAIALVTGVFGALLRKDMSLTKRVHSWFLGGKEQGKGSRYFTQYAKRLLLDAIDDEINSSRRAGSNTGSSAATLTRPCKILSGLLDRGELLDSLARDLALRVLRYARDLLKTPDMQFEREVRHSVSEVVAQLGNASVFAELERVVGDIEVVTDQENMSEIEQGTYELLSFAIMFAPVNDEIVRGRQLPALLRVAVGALSRVAGHPTTLKAAVAFCSNALAAMDVSTLRGKVLEDMERVMPEIAKSFTSFFVAWLDTSVEPAPAEMRRSCMDLTFEEEVTAEFKTTSIREISEEIVAVAKSSCVFLKILVVSRLCDLSAATGALQAAAKCAASGDARIALAGARAYADMAALCARDDTHLLSTEQTYSVVQKAWRLLHPSLPTSTAANAQVWLHLQRQFGSVVHDVAADGMLSSIPARRLRNLERFACLWRLAVEHNLTPLPADCTLFLLLDALDDRDRGPKILARSWLSDAMISNASAVLDAVLRLLLTPEARSTGPDHEFADVYDAPRALYAFHTLRSIIENAVFGHPGSVRGSGSLDVDDDDDETQAAAGSYSAASTHESPIIRAIATTSPTHRVTNALSSIISDTSGAAFEERSDTERKFARTSKEKITADDGPVKLIRLLPVLDYVTVLAITALSYLRGRIPAKYHVKVVSNGDKYSQIRPSGVLEEVVEDDDMEWVFAGLGYRAFGELNSAVAVAAAELLAKLLFSLRPSNSSGVRLAHMIAEPVMALAARSIVDKNVLLQIHFLDALEALVCLEDTGFTSNFRQEIGAGNPAGESMLLRGSGEFGGGKQPSERGFTETHPMFIPWALAGFSQACRAPSGGRDIGSEEIRCLRRRWIRFCGSVVKHLRSAFAPFSEGVLLTLCGLLEARHSQHNDAELRSFGTFPESEFSRIDERILLLKGSASICRVVVDAFEAGALTLSMTDEYLQAGDTSREVGVHNTIYNSAALESQLAGTVVHTVAPGRSSFVETNLAGETYLDPSAASTLQQVNNLPSVTEGAIGMGGSGTALASMNPLRMLNDFVKDVFIGTSSEGGTRLLDPRKDAARCLFLHLPRLMLAVVQSWGQYAPEGSLDVKGEDCAAVSQLSRRVNVTSRLSRDLPRERRQAQRAAVLAVVEPIFVSHPVDVIASIASMFCPREEISYTSSTQQFDSLSLDSRCEMAIDMLHAMEKATPEIVLSCAQVLLDTAMRWNARSPLAEDGRLQILRRKEAENAVELLLKKGVQGGMTHLRHVSGAGPQKVTGSVLSGVDSGSDVTAFARLGTGATVSAANLRPLFHAGDYFAAFSPGAVEIGVLRFLDTFLRGCKADNDVLGAWPCMHNIAKDVLASANRKPSIPALLRVLAASTTRPDGQELEKRHKKELMVVSASSVSTCNALALGTVDVSSEPQARPAEETRSTLMRLALDALAESLPSLIDAAFLDEGAQLASTVGGALSAAVLNLKRTAARASSVQNAARESKRMSNGTPLPSDRSVDDERDSAAALASAGVLLQISKREWGAKYVRKEVVGLLDDPNFFFAKRDLVLSRMASAVRESFASGGASVILSSIGSTTQLTSTGIPGLFTGRDSESVIRARAVRRVSFCIFVSEPDHYLAQLPTVLERLRDSLRLVSPILVVECFLCLRVLLLRTGPGSIAAFRATALSEMFRIISDPTQNLEETLAALQLLDLITLLSPPDFGYERCFFFTSDPVASAPEPRCHEENTVLYKPLVPEVVAMCGVSTESLNRDLYNDYGLRLDAGRTVFSGVLKAPLSPRFIALYAKALTARNRNPGMANATPNIETMRQEIEREFVQ